MTIEYWPEHDLLSITLSQVPYESAHSEEVREGVVLHFDTSDRLAEIELSPASERVDLDELRRRYSFEERTERHARSPAA